MTTMQTQICSVTHHCCSLLGRGQKPFDECSVRWTVSVCVNIHSNVTRDDNGRHIQRRPCQDKMRHHVGGSQEAVQDVLPNALLHAPIPFSVADFIEVRRWARRAGASSCSPCHDFMQRNRHVLVGWSQFCGQYSNWPSSRRVNENDIATR